MYAKIKSGSVVQYPYGVAELLADNPSTNFGVSPDVATLFPDTEEALIKGCVLVEVVASSPPEHKVRTHKAVAQTPILQDGVWVCGWAMVPKSEEEIAQDDVQQAKEVRADRNQRLAACDWTQLPDASVDKTAWATYRQALRDITSQASFPWGVDWPTAP
jgi:hypothetical protein